MNRRYYEEYAPLLRRSQPTSSLEKQEVDVVLREARGRENSGDGGDSSNDNVQEPRLPLHRQRVAFTERDNTDDEDSDYISFEFSQHDVRAEGRPTNPSEIPRYIVFDARGEMNARLDAVEEGFRFLVKRQEERQAQQQPQQIAVTKRYPKLQTFTSDEATPLIDHSPQQPQLSETQDFLKPIIPNESNHVQRDQQPANLKWTPRPWRQQQQSRRRAPTTQSLDATMRQLERKLRISVKEDRIRSDVSEEPTRRQEHKKRATKRLSELLAQQEAARQESQTTFATDQQVMGSLFTGKSNTTGTTTSVSIPHVQTIQEGEEFTVPQDLPVQSLQQQQVVLDDDARRAQEMVEREIEELKELKDSGDLTDSLKAFLREFHQSSQPEDSMEIWLLCGCTCTESFEDSRCDN